MTDDAQKNPAIQKLGDRYLTTLIGQQVGNDVHAALMAAWQKHCVANQQLTTDRKVMLMLSTIADLLANWAVFLAGRDEDGSNALGELLCQRLMQGIRRERNRPRGPAEQPPR